MRTRRLFGVLMAGMLVGVGCTSPPAPMPDASMDAAPDAAPDATPDAAADTLQPRADTGVCEDRDNDGHPSAACGGDDCDDNNPSRNPAVREVCGNMVDDDCDGTVDVQAMGVVYRDVDNDGRGDRSGAMGSTMMANACAPMAGWVANNDDCDDTRSETYAGAREQCDGRDNDCSLPGAMAGGTDSAEDQDGDRHSAISAMCLGRGEAGALASAFAKDDCNDSVPTAYPGAMEVCGNGVDDDCDRVVDNATQRVCDDRDGDGHGDPSTTRTVMSCMVPAGTVAVCDDCDDNAATGARRFPGNREVCDRVDNDCSTPGTAVAVDEDTDNDGYAATAATCLARGEAGASVTALPRGDCDDGRNAVNPGVSENVAVCDGLDNDCNPATSELTRPCAGGFCGEGGVCARAAVAQVVVGEAHTCARRNDGAVLCWGSNASGQLGDGTLVNRSAPVTVTGAGAAVELAAGGSHTCARRNDGTVVCWGRNAQGQLGDATTTSRSTPTLVPGVTNVVGLAANNEHTCALRGDGAVFCWGKNAFSQLGDGTTMNRAVPTRVAALSRVVEVSAGFEHTCARRDDGSVWCWGRVFGGVPAAVAGVSGATAITCGEQHTCVLRADTTILCWGANSSGQLGDGTTTNRPIPTVVLAVNGVAEITAGSAHTCALRVDGRGLCWGLNAQGQLGDGTLLNRSSATTLSSLSNAVEIAAGAAHTCARRNDATVVCWGANASGQIGDGSTTQRVAPVMVSL